MRCSQGSQSRYSESWRTGRTPGAVLDQDGLRVWPEPDDPAKNPSRQDVAVPRLALCTTEPAGAKHLLRDSEVLAYGEPAGRVFRDKRRMLARLAVEITKVEVALASREQIGRLERTAPSTISSNGLSDFTVKICNVRATTAGVGSMRSIDATVCWMRCSSDVIAAARAWAARTAWACTDPGAARARYCGKPHNAKSCDGSGQAGQPTNATKVDEGP